MIRFGLTLLVPSSTAVVLRIMEYPYFMGPVVRAFCLFSLTLAAASFVATYCKVSWPKHRRSHHLQVAHAISR